jgi:hypothetical protein
LTFDLAAAPPFVKTIFARGWLPKHPFINTSRTFIETIAAVPLEPPFLIANCEARIELISPSTQSRQLYAPKLVSSSRKEENPVTVTIDRPVLVLTVSIQKGK